MIEGALSFIGAAIVASSLGASPASGLVPPWAVAVAYVVLFDILHRIVEARVGARLERVAAGLAPPARLRLWPVIVSQWVGFAIVLLGGWGTQVQAAWEPGSWFLVQDAAVIAPWLAVHVSWLLRRRAILDRLRRGHWPALHYVAFHLRFLVLPALPILITMSLDALASRQDRIGAFMQSYGSLTLVGTMTMMLLIVSLSPFVVRLAFATTSMPDGPLRRRFEDLARRAGFRYLDIRVCHTFGQVMNAAFVGVLGRLRYVIMTDAILQKLSDDDLMGVFAHEMGHSMRRHILLNMALMLGFVMAFQLLGTQLEPGAAGDLWLTAAFLGGLALFVFFVFSPIARSFETEADVYAGEVLGDPGPIARALDTLGWIYPDKRKRGGLIHPSIVSRVGFLERYFSDSTVAEAFRGRMRRLRRMIVGFAGVPLVVWGATLPGDMAEASVRMDAEVAYREDDEAKALAALERVREAVRSEQLDDSDFWLRMRLWQVISTERQDAGDYAGAEPYLELMRRHRGELVGRVPRYNAAIILAQQAAAVGDWEALSEELARARPLLREIASERGDADEGVAQERRDVALLTAGLHLLARRGLVAPAEEHTLLPALPDAPESDALRGLSRAVDAGLPPVLSPREEARLEALDHRWRRDYLRSLSAALSRG